MDTQEQINPFIGEFQKYLRIVLREKFHAAFVHGAAAINDSLPTGDMDFHVIMEDHLTDTEKQELDDLREELATKFPPLGSEVDGFYILSEDARRKTPPLSESGRGQPTMPGRSTANSFERVAISHCTAEIRGRPTLQVAGPKLRLPWWIKSST